MRKIKNEKLRKFLKDYYRYVDLKESEKKALLHKLSFMNEAEQEKIYEDFMKDNMREVLKKVKTLTEKIKELGGSVKKAGAKGSGLKLISARTSSTCRAVNRKKRNFPSTFFRPTRTATTLSAFLRICFLVFINLFLTISY